MILPIAMGHESSAGDLVLLSQRFNQDSLSNEVVGELLNSGTRPLDKYDINIFASFYDSAGQIVGSEQGVVDAQTLGPGDRSAFNIFTTDNAIMNDATNYDLTINDQRVLEGASISGDGGGDTSTDGNSSNEGGNNEGSGE
jgi:hypothetical protein